LQQRGVEFLQLFGSHNHLREPLLEKMPAMTINRINGANGNGEVEVSEVQISSEKSVSNGRSNTDTLLDLLGSGDDIIMSAPTAAPTTNAPVTTSNLLDLLGDIDLSAPAAPVMTSNNNNNNLTSPVTMSILDDNENSKIPDGSVFGLNGVSAPGNYDLGLGFLAPSTTTLAKIVTALDKNDLMVQLAAVNESDHQQITMTTTNNSMDTLEQYLFQVS
jgi:AP-1 complex subunit gamma-1